MEKYLWLFTAMTFTTVLAVSCSGTPSHNGNGESLPGQTVTSYEAADANVLPLGRTYWAGGAVKELWLAYSGAGAAFTFVGTKLDITFAGNQTGAGGKNARIAVYVGGERKADILMAQKERTVTVYYNKTELTTPIEVRIIKLSESSESLAGIKKITVTAFSDYGIKPAAQKTLKMEFIGDSITAAYGIDDIGNKESFKTATEDVTKTYVYKTAKAFNADFSMVCVSGIGIISNGVQNNGNKNTNNVMPLIYDKTGSQTYLGEERLPGGLTPLSQVWDFNKFQPDIVVINLGTNDNGYVTWSNKTHITARGNEFAEGYVKFLKDIRAKNPNAKILCTINLMSAEDIWPYIQKAVSDYKAQTGENDSNIAAFKLPAQDVGWNGVTGTNIGTDWHPLENSNVKAAKALVTEIERFTGWTNNDVLENEADLFAANMVK
jgi:lysophospholipase L1-like esterase